MRKIITTTFMTLDGVMQAPGGPGEDPANGFGWEGWSVNYWDEMMGSVMGGFIEKPFDLLLGRRTYEIFAAHWPYVKDEPIAEKFNKTAKYVVSGKSMDLAWQNSILIQGNVVSRLKKLKQQEGNDLWVHGSGKLVQALLANNLIDTLHLWIFPVTIGEGKRLFAEGTRAQALKLVESRVATTGVIIATYEPAGDLVTGSFALENPSEAELERRKRHAAEG
ncbi:MAG: dihydrofolate reductase family protein [Calditrichia bacterium]